MPIIFKVLFYFNRLIEDFAKVHFKLRYACYRKKYSIHPKFRFNGWSISFSGHGTIRCGANSYIGRHSSVEAYDDCCVVIGDKVSISHFVHIYTINHKADKDFSANDDSSRMGDVLIGNYCWIGIKSTIIGPCNIGENSVIAANSLVSRDIPPHSIVMGVPAKVIKFKSYLPTEKQIDLANQYRKVISDKLLLELGLMKQEIN